MRIISIDPGYERLGIAIIEKLSRSKEVLVFSECFKTSSKDPHPIRLGRIHQHLEEIVETYRPEALSIETLFFQKNISTALPVAEARGAVIALCAARGIPVFEFGPGQIKAAVTGSGSSDKNQVIKMIPLLIDLGPAKPLKLDDEYDAIAAGLTYFAHYPVR